MKLRRYIPILTLTILAAGCDTLQVEADTPGSDTLKNGKGDKALPCDDATDCGSCLEIDGCNWTGGMCADTCLQDTDCYGPGNAAAPSCSPAVIPPPPPPPACGDLTDEQACLDRDDCARVCLEASDNVCSQFVACQDKTAPSCETLIEEECYQRDDCEWTTEPGFPGPISSCKDKAPPKCNTLAETECTARDDCEWITEDGFPGPISRCKDKIDCGAMDAGGIGDCEAIFGYAWNGTACLGISGCSCVGADCGETFDTIALCESAYASCITCDMAWIDETGACRSPVDGAYPDLCCEAERKTKCDAINDKYKAAVTAAKSCSFMVTAPQCQEYVDEELDCPICGTYVNDKSALQPITVEWNTMRCSTVAGACPPVACDPPSGGMCGTNNTCSDVFAP